MRRVVIAVVVLFGLVSLPVWAGSPLLTVEPRQVALVMNEGAASGTFTVTAGAKVSGLKFSASGLKDGQGVTGATPTISTDPPSASSLDVGKQLTVTVSLDELPPPGSYTGQITIAYTAPVTGSKVVDLALEVRGPSYEPDKLDMTVELTRGRASGEFRIIAGDTDLKGLKLAPSALKNAKGEPVAAKIAVDPASKGSLAAGEPLTVTVSLGGLPAPDRYTGQIGISYDGQAEDSPQAVSLTLEIPGQVDLSSNALVFRARPRGFPIGSSFKFEPQEITVYSDGNYTYTLSVSAPQLSPRSENGKLLLKNGTRDSLDVYVCDKAALSAGACDEKSDKVLTPFHTANNPATLVIRPDRLSHTGVYSGNITLTFKPAGGGSPIVKTVPVRAVATDGPLYPFLVLALGVALVTLLVYLQETGKEKTKIQLRSAGLTLRLSALVAGAWDQAFSSRFADRVKDQMRDIKYRWQSGDKVDDLKTALDSIDAFVDGLAERMALLGSAAESLDQGKLTFRLKGEPKQRIAGEARLKQARIELGGGDYESAKSSMKDAVEIYQEAFGRYSLLAFKHQEILRAYDRHADTLKKAWPRIEEALQRSDALIDALEKTGGAVAGKDELERLDYWRQALQTVGEAIDKVAALGDNAAAALKPKLSEALARLGEATVDNVKVPREDGRKDKLQEAEVRAGEVIAEAEKAGGREMAGKPEVAEDAQKALTEREDKSRAEQERERQERLNRVRRAIEAAELLTRNQGLLMEESAGKGESLLKRLWPWLTGRDAPDIDCETSVDDPFAFEVKIGAASPGECAFEWYIDDDPGTDRSRWREVAPVPGRAGNQLVHRFDKPGTKGIKVSIKPKETAEDKQVRCKFFAVGPSRHRLLLRSKAREALAEGVMVVAFASLIGLGLTYFGDTVESFGTLADYLTALVFGATAKTTQEALSAMPEWFKKLLGKSG